MKNESDHAQHTWVLVLAGGEGKRLHSLTTDKNGIAIPKQYCAFNGHQSLLTDAVRRGLPLAPPERIMLIVATEHRQWWHAQTSLLPPANIIVQPRNRGTGPGILLPLLEILERDAAANIVLLPSDHFVRDEDVLLKSMRQGLRALHHSGDSIVLLGVTPEEADPDLGYLLPGFADEADTLRVRRFVEKPDLNMARRLVARGAMWNSFVLVAKAAQLLELFLRQCRTLTRIIMDARQDSRSDAGISLDVAYRVIPPFDFSAGILAGAESALRVVRVPACGWSDLGTPRRVAQCIERMRTNPHRERQLSDSSNPAALNLLDVHIGRSLAFS